MQQNAQRYREQVSADELGLVGCVRQWNGLEQVKQLWIENIKTIHQLTHYNIAN